MITRADCRELCALGVFRCDRAGERMRQAERELDPVARRELEEAADRDLDRSEALLHEARAALAEARSMRIWLT